MTYYISAKRFYFENKIKEGGYLAVVDGRFGDWTEKVPEGAEHWITVIIRLLRVL